MPSSTNRFNLQRAWRAIALLILASWVLPQACAASRNLRLSYSGQLTTQDRAATVAVIRRRLEAYGAKGVNVRDTQGGIVVSASDPKAIDPAHLRGLIERRGQLRLAPVSADGAVDDKSALVIVRVASVQRAASEDALTIELLPGDASAFTALTARQMGQKIAILVDDEVLMTPRVLDPIAGGRILLTTKEKDPELRELAGILGGGALPGPVRLIPQ
jgi:preprotein translocase subunit SecD